MGRIGESYCHQVLSEVPRIKGSSLSRANDIPTGIKAVMAWVVPLSDEWYRTSMAVALPLATMSVYARQRDAAVRRPIRNKEYMMN